MPTSVSGYSLCGTHGDPIDEESSISNEATNNNYVQDQVTPVTHSARQNQLQHHSVIYEEPLITRNGTSGDSSMHSKAGLAMSASNYSMSSGI